jgi:hypothetical protein
MLRRPLYVILNFTFIGILSVIMSGLAVAEQDTESANFWLPFCRQVITGHLPQGDAFNDGACAGTIAGLMYTGRSVGVCAPEGATREQALRVVVQYLDQRPARTNENFEDLVVEAMRAAWPCNH